ncbi:MAG: hypothetical protein D3907_09430 [Candidatus Electrothrix sp. AUS3]|nr:hypothetical protein [Candidatus Electrothrix gigas]
MNKWCNDFLISVLENATTCTPTYPSFSDLASSLTIFLVLSWPCTLLFDKQQVLAYSMITIFFSPETSVALEAFCFSLFLLFMIE